MIDKVAVFFSDVLASFLYQLNPAEQFLAALTITLPFFALIGTIRRYYLNKNQGLAAELAAEKRASLNWLQKYNKAAERVSDLESEATANWISAFNEEKKLGNEMIAIGTLRDRMNRISRDLAACADELARYHLSVSSEFGDDHLAEAYRYYKIASLLSGLTQERSRALIELSTTQAALDTSNSIDKSTWGDIQAAYDALSIDRDTIIEMNKRSEHLHSNGHYLTSYYLNLRTLTLANRITFLLDPVVLYTRWLTGVTLHSIGEFSKAIEAINQLIPDAKIVYGEDSIFHICLLHLKCINLTELGNYRDAINLLYSFEKKQINNLGHSHSDVLATRSLKSSLLNELGYHSEALKCIDDTIFLYKNTIGDKTKDYYILLFVRAKILDDIGRHSDALSLLNSFSYRQENLLGPAHPDTLSTEARRVKILKNIGMYGDALKHADILIENRSEILGNLHPHYYLSLNLKIEVLICLERYQEAFKYIKEIESSLEQSIYIPSPIWKQFQELKIDTLIATGDIVSAANIIDLLLPIQKDTLGPEHPRTKKLEDQKKEIAPLNPQARIKESPTRPL